MKPCLPSRNVLLAVAIAFLPLQLPAAEVKIIANSSIKSDSISVSELRSVFLSETRSLKDGSHVEPVFERSGPVHEAFVREFLRQSNESLRTYYGGLVFTGKASMPKTFDSDQDVLTYVSHTKGAIGYVSESASSEGAKVMEVTGGATKSQRTLVTRVEPQYPETLRRLGIGGTVRLRIVISPQGRVESANLLGGNPILGEEAIKAVTQWIYSPASSPSTIEVAIPFGADR